MTRVDLKTAAAIDSAPGEVTEITVTATREERAAAVAAAIAGKHPIAVPFAKFNDGRGFSIARLLRSDQGFQGEILATGHTIPDQALHLLRSGFDTVEVADASRLSQWLKSLAIYGGAYQPAARNPLALRREASQLQATNEPSPSGPETLEAPKSDKAEHIREVA